MNSSGKMIYKYRSLLMDSDSDFCKIDSNTEKLIKNGELYFADPDTFNDPFDCGVRFDKSKLNIFGGLSTDNLLNDATGTGIKNGLIKVFCASKDYDNMLLWAHYAQQHEGVCIGIQTYEYGNRIALRKDSSQLRNAKRKNAMNMLQEDTLRFMEANGLMDSIADSNGCIEVFSVKYSNVFLPSIDPLKIGNIPETAIMEYFLRKATCWESEHEVRALLSAGETDRNICHIATQDIKEIIFGLNTPVETCHKTIDDLKNSLDHHVDFYKMHQVPDRFKLERVPL